MNLRPYNVRPTGQRPEGAMYKNIPIAQLQEVRAFFKSKGIKTRIRYRGPRTNPLDIRPKHRRMQDCSKRFANRFSVYFA
jgi:hypothetical protein